MKGPLTIEIPRRNSLCSQGAETLIPGMEFISVIDNENSDLYLRKDYCLSCWKKLADDKEKSKAIQWKSRLPLKPEAQSNKAHLQSRNERAFDLLKTALQSTEQSDLDEAFVLALFLARNRQLALRQEIKQDNGQYFFLYEVLATEEMIAVPRVLLSDLQTEKIQQDLAKKFK